MRKRLRRPLEKLPRTERLPLRPRRRLSLMGRLCRRQKLDRQRIFDALATGAAVASSVMTPATETVDEAAGDAAPSSVTTAAAPTLADAVTVAAP